MLEWFFLQLDVLPGPSRNRLRRRRVVQATTYQGSDEGAQELVDGLSDFSAAVGIVIKPSKTTWNKTEDFTLGEPTRTELEDITTQHVHRLGNTQRMDGSSKKTV